MTRTDPAAYWYDMWYAERTRNQVLEGRIADALRACFNVNCGVCRALTGKGTS